MHCLAGSHIKKILPGLAVQTSYNEDPLTNTLIGMLTAYIIFLYD